MNGPTHSEIQLEILGSETFSNHKHLQIYQSVSKVGGYNHKSVNIASDQNR